MFNADYKKEALAAYEKEGKVYKQKYEETIENVSMLHSHKESACTLLKKVEDYFNHLKNKPYEFEKVIEEISVRRRNFEVELNELKLESKQADKTFGSMAGAGALAGGGVAAFGPTAAMAIATTFGTASTGTAIATLSGAAATNAALAWLGGGALVAGGGGIAAGNALLAMAGPVGWAIGGIGLIGGGLLYNNKNKEIAQKAKRETTKLKEERDKINRINTKVQLEIKAIVPEINGIKDNLNYMFDTRYNDFNSIKRNKEAYHTIIILKNTSEALSKRIVEKIE